jgi:hypothetical protein
MYPKCRSKFSYDPVVTGFRPPDRQRIPREVSALTRGHFRAETDCGESPAKEQGNGGGALRNGNWAGLVTRVRKGGERFAADVPPDRRSGEVTRRGSRFPIIMFQLIRAEREAVTAS